MTTKPQVFRALLFSGALATITPQALADREGTLTLYLNAGQHWFDAARLDGTPYQGLELEDSSGGGIGFGYNVTDHWAIEGVYDVFSVNVEDSDLDVGVRNYHVDLLYQFGGRFCGNFDWQPYVVVGAGEVRIDDDSDYLPLDVPLDWHRRQTMVNFGAGIKYRLAPRWQVRADARGFQGVEEGGVDSFVSLSIGYQWGADPVVYDRDGDGIFSDMDECPQTPPGLDVDVRGCPIDSDGDGVADYQDRCAMTPMGQTVNDEGCAREPYDPADFVK